MACGLPVVASDVGGIPDQIAEGQNGFLVQVGDSVGMAERIERLLNDKIMRKTMGQQASQRARAEFGISNMTANYLNYYASVISHTALPTI